MAPRICHRPLGGCLGLENWSIWFSSGVCFQSQIEQNSFLLGCAVREDHGAVQADPSDASCGRENGICRSHNFLWGHHSDCRHAWHYREVPGGKAFIDSCGCLGPAVTWSKLDEANLTLLFKHGANIRQCSLKLEVLFIRDGSVLRFFSNSFIYGIRKSVFVKGLASEYEGAI